MEEGLSPSEMWHRRRLLVLMWGGTLIASVGIQVNMWSESLGLRALSLFGVVCGCALVTLAVVIEYQRVLGDLRELLAQTGSLVPVEREALLSRLNRAANEYPTYGRWPASW